MAAGAEAVLQVVLKLRNEMAGELNGIQGQLQGLASKAGLVGAGLTAGITLPLVAIGKAAIETAASFESQMNILTVAARSSGTSMEQLSKAALLVGKDTQLVGINSAQAADAMTNFYKAGLNTTDIFGDLNQYLKDGTNLTGALRSAIDLAAASELDLNQASMLTATSMATFGLNANEASRIANAFVQAADASQASVTDLYMAMQNIGPTAAAFGWSIEQTNTALALLSTRGIMGAEAGTALKSMMTNLMSNTKETTAALDALNVSLYDQQGNMLPLDNIIGQLAQSMAGMTEEQRNQYIQTLAGTYGMKALNTLLAEGVPGWNNMAQAIKDAATAQEVGEARTKGMAAAWEQFKGALETLYITVALPIIQNFLTPLVKHLTDAANAFTSLNPNVQTTVVTFLAVLAAIGPVTGAFGGLLAVVAKIGPLFLTLISPITSAISALQGFVASQQALAAMQGIHLTSMQALVVSFQTLGAAIWAAIAPIAPFVLAIGGIVAVLVLLKQHTDAAKQAAYDQAGQIAATSGSYDTYIRRMGDAGLAEQALTEETWKHVESMKEEEQAILASQFAQKMAEWKESLEQLEFQYNQDVIAAMAYNVSQEAVSAGTLNLRSATLDQIASYAALHPAILKTIEANGLLSEAEAKRVTSMAQAIQEDERYRYAAQLTGETVKGAADKATAAANQIAASANTIGNAWDVAMRAIEATTNKYTNESQKKIFEHFAQAQKGYAQHAVNIAKLESEKQNALIKLEAEGANIRLKLEKAGNDAGLKQLVAALNQKRAGILTYYNGRIATEKTAQQTLYDIAKVYYQNSLSALQTTLRGQLDAHAVQMVDLVRIASSGYGAMAQAAAAYYGVVKSEGDINATRAAINEVQAAFDAIAQGGIAAAQAAQAEFNAWTASSSSLSDALEAVGVDMDSVSASADHAGSSASAGTTRVVDPIEEAAKVVERIGKMLESAKAAFDKLVDYGGPQAGWEVGFNKLLDGVKTLVLRVADVAAELKAAGLFEIENTETGAGPMARIQAFMEAVGVISEATNKAVETLTVLGDWQNLDGLTDAIHDIAGYIGEMVTTLADIATTVSAEGQAAAKAFAEAAGPVIETIGNACTTLLGLASWQDLHGLTGALNNIMHWLKMAVTIMAAVAAEVRSNLQTEAAAFAEVTGPVMETIGGALETLTALAGWRDLHGLTNALNNIAHWLKMAVWIMASIVAGVDKDMQQAASELAAAAGPVLATFGGAMGTLQKLAEWGDLHGLTNALNNIAHWLKMAVWIMAKVAQEIGMGMQAAASEFAKNSKGVLDTFGGAMETLLKLSEWEDLHGLTNALNNIAHWLKLASFILGTVGQEIGTTMQTAAVTFATNAKTVIGVIADGMKAFDALATWEPAAVLTDLVAAGGPLDQLTVFLRDLALYMGQAGQDLGELAQSAADFAAKAKTVTGVVLDGMKAFGDLAGWEPPTEVMALKAKMNTLAGFLLQLALSMAEAAGIIGGELMATAADFATKAKTVSGVIVDSVKAFATLFEWEPPVAVMELKSKMNVLAGFLLQLSLSMTEAAGIIGGELMAAAADFAAKAKTITGVIVDGQKAFDALTTWEPPAAVMSLKANMNTLAGFLLQLALSMAEVAGIIGSELAGAAAAFAAAAKTTVGVVADAMKAFEAFAEWEPPAAVMSLKEKFNTLSGFLFQWSLAIWQAFYTIDTTVAAAITAFSNAAKATLGMVTEGMEAFAEFADWQPPAEVMTLTEKFAQLSGFLWQWARAIWQAFQTIDTTVAANITAFANAAKSTVGLVADSMKAFDTLAEWKPEAAVVDLLGKMTTLGGFLFALADAILDAFETMTVEVAGAAKSFAEAAKSVIGVVAEGIKAFGAIAEWDQPAAVADLATRMQALAEFAAALAQALADVTLDVTALESGAAKTFADDAKSVIGVIGEAIKTFTSVAEWMPKVTTADLQKRITELTTFIQTLVAKLGEMAQAIGANGTTGATAAAAAATFAQNAGDVIKTTSDAIKTLGEISELTVPTDSQIKTVLVKVGGLITTLIEQFGKLNTDHGTLLAALATFIENVATTMTDLKAGIQALKEIGEIEAPAIGLQWIAQLYNAMTLGIPTIRQLLTTITEIFTNFKPDGYSAGADFMRTLARGLHSGLSQVEAELEALAELFPHSPAKAGPLRIPPDWQSFLFGGLKPATAEVGRLLGGLGDLSSMSVGRPMTPFGPIAPAFAPSYAPTVTPVAAYGGGGTTIHFTYAPVVSLASQREAEEVIAPMLARIVTRESRRG